MWDLDTLKKLNDEAIEAARNAARLLEAEYMALCGAIERNCTEGGFKYFKEDPMSLRKRVRELERHYMVEYPNKSQIESFLMFIPKI